jgi:hypothetical protein
MANYQFKDTVYVYGHQCEHNLHNVGYSFNNIYEALHGRDLHTGIPIHSSRSRINSNQLRWATTQFSNYEGDSYDLSVSDLGCVLPHANPSTYSSYSLEELYHIQLSVWDWNEVLYTDTAGVQLHQPDGFIYSCYAPLESYVSRVTWANSILKTLE